ncbi:uncharacterized protein LOC128679715 [Plodia interpunctella]|uniref:uncharacterized protein LOC128679715 n=1 Tax=Plodia interpunctella TaxID=58824 RepID=UPI002367F063|nr:uncharacterized protein LOC128679715 [Plodia interpunctella]
MADDMENPCMLEFIQKYKELECLWKTTHCDYGNRYRRLEALKELLPVMKKQDPNADLNALKRKINCMRSVFNRQHRKVMESRKYYMDEYDKEADLNKLRYYKKMLFLVDRNSTTKDTDESRSTRQLSGFSEDETEETIYLEEDISNEETDHLNEYMKEEAETPLSGTSTPTKQHREKITILPRIRKRKLTDLNKKRKQSTTSNRQAVYLLDESDQPSSSNTQQFNAFGLHVAERLRGLRKEMSVYCQKIINDAIFHAEIGDLNRTSRIVN